MVVIMLASLDGAGARRLFIQLLVGHQLVNARPAVGPLFRFDAVADGFFDFKEMCVHFFQQGAIRGCIGFAVQANFERVDGRAAHPHLIMNGAFGIIELDECITLPGMKVAIGVGEGGASVTGDEIQKIVNAHDETVWTRNNAGNADF